MSCLKRVGVIGAGQLARMMYGPSVSLGIDMNLLAEQADSASVAIYGTWRVGDYTDEATVRSFAADVDALTFDHEHVPTEILRRLEADGIACRPGPDALQYAQDKYLMRKRLAEFDAPAPAWRMCRDADELRAFGDEIGWPVIAKESRGGYDGHGVWKCDGPDDADVPFASSLDESAGERVVILGEEFVDFSRELSVIVVRGADGEVRSYPVTETIQRDGVCNETISPAPGLSEERAAKIRQLGVRIAEELGVVGLLAVELMQRRSGEVVVNELAMRPHNTGHWTIDGAVTSQFENHLRAVAGLPLGSTRMSAPVCVMVNVLGSRYDDLHIPLAEALSDPDVRVELYGKSVRPGRKIGHVNVAADDVETAQRAARRAAAMLRGDRHE